MSLLQAESTLLQLANIAGLNDWKLIQGMYNGCTFFSLQDANSLLTSNPIGQTINNASVVYNRFFGTSQRGADLNANGNLFSTTLSLNNINDVLSRKFVRKRLPYSNQDNIEDMGLSGWSFNMNVIFFGVDYLTGFNNFLNAIQSPSIKNKNKLIHPIYGSISGNTYLVNIKPKYNSDARQAVMIELQFEAEQSLAWIQNPVSFSNIAANALTGLLQAVGAVGLAVNLSSRLAK